MAQAVMDKDEELMTGAWDDDDDTQSNKFMLFKIGMEVYGIAIRHVIEIVEMQKITMVPDMPVFVKGVINLRGKIIPVIDVRLRFRMDERPYDDRNCVVIVNVQGTTVGLIVDTVREVQTIAESNIEAPPNFRSTAGHDLYISGLGKVGQDIRILLDADKLLHENDLAVIKSNNESKE